MEWKRKWELRHQLPYEPSAAQVRALQLALDEGSLWYHRGAWAPPSRAKNLGPNDKLGQPYAQGGSVFVLERNGFLVADPNIPPGSRPRPRVITASGRAYLNGKR